MRVSESGGSSADVPKSREKFDLANQPSPSSVYAEEIEDEANSE